MRRAKMLGVAADSLTYVLLLGCGALQFCLSQRSADFYDGDTTYVELARSLLDEGVYGFNGQFQTTLPPGFPSLLALICVVGGGCRYGVLIHSMAVFATLGLIASYELLRRDEGRVVAGAFCLLLGSSQVLFVISTRAVMADVPYWFTSIATLVVAGRLDVAKRRAVRASLWATCSVLLVWSVLIRSAGIALLVGLAGWLAASKFVARDAAARRFKTFLPLLLIGLVMQGLWMHWAAQRETVEWPLVGGYPHSYFAQLHVKNGNYPELGMASLGDIPLRAVQNVSDRAAWLIYVLARKSPNPDWFSPIVVGSILLVFVGLGCSIWRGGGRWQEWYFVSHEAMYLLWPWEEIRFVIPVLPLACLYLWRGGKAFVDVAFRKPRTVAAWSFVPSLLLGGAAATASSSPSVEPVLAAIFWTSAAATCAWTVWAGQRRLPAWLGRLLSRSMVISWGKSVTLRSVIGVVAMVFLVEAGIARQVRAGRENLAFDVTKDQHYPDIKAGLWLRGHTPVTAVVMARQADVVYHYSRRRVVWFPPLREPQQLIDGLRRHRVEYVVVNRRENGYWLPPDQDCFEPLLSAHPSAFTLVHEEFRLRIFQIVPTPPWRAAGDGVVS